MSGAEMEEGELSDGGGGVDFTAPNLKSQPGVRFAGFQAAPRGAFGGFDPDFMGGRGLPVRK